MHTCQQIAKTAAAASQKPIFFPSLSTELRNDILYLILSTNQHMTITGMDVDKTSAVHILDKLQQVDD